MIYLQRRKNRRAITALPNTESGLLQKALDAESNFNAEYTSCNSYSRGETQAFPLVFSLVIHNAYLVEWETIAVIDCII